MTENNFVPKKYRDLNNQTTYIQNSENHDWYDYYRNGVLIKKEETHFVNVDFMVRHKYYELITD